MTPTIGRIVHFHPQVASVDVDPDTSPLPVLTYAAIVVGVSDGGEIVLLVLPPLAEPWHCTYAKFSETPESGCWTWPPRA